ncbi:hypothetical protein B0H14DRAFT_3160654 [Mycena olivaceomarginata]|nr:hypothetical protein B0H14DRAFT_3160654 [Mycena olivaceomarginata]
MFPKKLPKGQKSSKERVMTVTGSCLAKRSEHGPQQVGIHENTQKQVPLHYAVMRSCTCAAANPSTRITGECDDEEYRRGFDRVSGNRFPSGKQNPSGKSWQELADLADLARTSPDPPESQLIVEEIERSKFDEWGDANHQELKVDPYNLKPKPETAPNACAGELDVAPRRRHLKQSSGAKKKLDQRDGIWLGKKSRIDGDSTRGVDKFEGDFGIETSEPQMYSRARKIQRPMKVRTLWGGERETEVGEDESSSRAGARKLGFYPHRGNAAAVREIERICGAVREMPRRTGLSPLTGLPASFDLAAAAYAYVKQRQASSSTQDVFPTQDVLPRPPSPPSQLCCLTLRAAHPMSPQERCVALSSPRIKSHCPFPVSSIWSNVMGVLTRSRGHPFKPAAVYDVPVAMFACNAPPVPPMPKIVHRSPQPVTPKVAVTPPTSASDSILSFDNEEAVGVEAQLCQAQRLECWTRSPLLPRPTRPKHARKI